MEKIAIDKIGVENGWSRETQLIMKELSCKVTQLAASAAGPQLYGQIESNYLGTNLDFKTEDVTEGWEKNKSGEWEKLHVETHPLIDLPRVGWTSTILAKDDLTDNEQTKQSNLVNKVMVSPITSPIDDSDFTFADLAQAMRVLTDLQLNAGGRGSYPVSYNTDFNMETDESFSRIFWHGMAAPLVMDMPEVTNEEWLKYGPFGE